MATEDGNGIHDLEKRLWGAADELRANSKLKSSEYSAENVEKLLEK